MRLRLVKMNKYNFDKLTDRKGTSSYKWDHSKKDNRLPMFVADMDFEVLPEIKEALTKRVNIGSYGYSMIPEEYFSALISWFKRRHNLDIKREWMIYSNGVIPAVSSIVRRITKPGDNVLTLSPVYNTFYSSILNNGRKLVQSKLIENNGVFSIDFIDLEEKLKDEHTELFIFCNPHNPIGKVWSKEDIRQVSELANKYGVVVLSDEIHCDIVKPGVKYNPYLENCLSLDNVIVTVSAAKAFNLSGLQAAACIIPNEDLRKIIDRGLNNDEVAEPNFFSMDATISALNQGDLYIDELNEYIENNKQYVYDFFEKNLKEGKVIKGEATYLLWIDLRAYMSDSKRFVEELDNETGLLLCPGINYGPNGEGFVRMNIATSLDNVKDGCNRLLSFIKKGR